MRLLRDYRPTGRRGAGTVIVMTSVSDATPAPAPRDRLGRGLSDLRVSVTDRCNLRCRYCMPREIFGPDHAFLERDELLSFEEIARLVRVVAGLGVRKVRLTGGEPLLRRDLSSLVAQLADVDGIEELALTTNGLLLPGLAEDLATAGLTRVTVSLDALDDDIFKRMSDTAASVDGVLRGIEAAQRAGLEPVKVNTVLQAGVNDDQIEAMAAFGRERGVTVRFIEFMDVGTSNGWRRDQVVPAAEVVQRLDARWPLEPVDGEVGVAERYRYRDGAGEVGVIASVTRPFCRTCDRARLSAVGELFTCLFAARGHDLRAPLRDGSQDTELEALLARLWGLRTDRASELRAENGLTGERVEMSYIGG
jgi:GTP 3',8-cyclase